MSDKPQSSATKKALIIALILLIGLVVVWHILLPTLGLAVVVTGSVWTTIIATVIALTALALLFFILSGLWILILGLLALMWVIFAIIIFPFLFPLFIPILIIVLFIGFIRRRSQK